ncbi:MAG: helix-turn-helix transcriptional regulator [Actinobacteria bacterium]|nr:helix-turn-helix transcriptional regulator [Actinomycetota bacterium]
MNVVIPQSKGQPGPTVGDRLQRLRKERKLSRTDLASISGVSFPTIGRAERGERIPRRWTLCRLAAALDVPVGRLTGESDE